MRKSIKYLPTSFIQWVSFCLLLITTPVWADKDQREEWTLNLYVENDLFSETDQDYTSGVRLSWVSPDLSDYVDNDELPEWIKRVNRRLTFFHKSHEGLKRNVIISLGQQIYTPQNLNQTELIKDDRPYAAWLFLGFGFQTRAENQLDTLEVRLGVVGPGAFGQETQDFIHDLRGFDKFLGWNNQLHNEPGFVAVWEHKRKRSWRNDNSRFGFDTVGHAGVTLGNVGAHLNAGAEFRVGWAIPDDFGTSAIRPGGENSTPDSVWDPRVELDRRWGLHAFAGFDVRLVGYDIFLDGNSFRDSHSIAKESVVADAAVGLSFIYQGAKISYAQIFRSKEFSGQASSHSYGSLAFSYTF
jgi:lipid A 3-O-deacylase